MLWNGISQLFMLSWKFDRPFLCELPILFSTVKLKLGHKLFQFIHKFKIWILKCWSFGCIYFQVFPNSWKRWKIGIFEYTLFFYKHMGKLGWSSICLRFPKFEPEIMLDGMLNFKTHIIVWYCASYEHCNGLF